MYQCSFDMKLGEDLPEADQSVGLAAFLVMLVEQLHSDP